MEEEYVVIDGALYHSGKKGMQWGKHLPGTTWWKEDKPSRLKGSVDTSSTGSPVKPKPTSGRKRVSKLDGQDKNGDFWSRYNSGENELGRKINGYNRAKRREPSTFRKDYSHVLDETYEPEYGTYTRIARVRDRKPGNRDTSTYKINKAKDNISKAWESGKKKAGEAWESGKKKAGEAWDKANGIGRNIYDDVGSALKSGKKGLSKLWGNSKKYSSEQISKLKDQAKKAYAKTGPLVQSYFEKSSEKYSKGVVNPPKGSDGINHLAEYIDKEMEDAVRAYGDMQKSGSAGNMLNSFIQTSQMNIVNGCARFLDSIGLDDEVASFLSKLKIKK